jgi:hypothetical protein
MENRMKKLTVLLIAVFAIGGLSLSTGCKGDKDDKDKGANLCEKAVTNFENVMKKKLEGEDREKWLWGCNASPKELQECLSEATTQKAFVQCQ